MKNINKQNKIIKKKKSINANAYSNFLKFYKYLK